MDRGALKELAKRILPAPVRRWMRITYVRVSERPPYKMVRWGSLRRVTTDPRPVGLSGVETISIVITSSVISSKTHFASGAEFSNSRETNIRSVSAETVSRIRMCWTCDRIMRWLPSSLISRSETIFPAMHLTA